MPASPMKPCRHAGCRRLTKERYCDEHKPLHAWVHSKETPRLRGRKLQKERERLFNEQPLCVECERQGRVRAATQRDHIVPLAEGGQDVPGNIQGLCSECHSAKSQEEAKRGRHGKL